MMIRLIVAAWGQTSWRVSDRAPRVSRGCGYVYGRMPRPLRAASPPRARRRSSRTGPSPWRGRRASSWCWASSRHASLPSRKRGRPSGRLPRLTTAAARTVRSVHRQSRRPAPRLSLPSPHFPEYRAVRLNHRLALPRRSRLLRLSCRFARLALTRILTFRNVEYYRCPGEGTTEGRGTQGKERRVEAWRAPWRGATHTREERGLWLRACSRWT